MIPALACSLNLGAQVPGTTGAVTGKDGITYATVVALDTLVWTQQNLGATQAGTSFTDSNAYGDLYQWGRWRDGHQTRNPDNITTTQASPNDPSGYNSQPGNPFYAGWWWNASTGGGWHWTAATPADIDSATGCDPCKQLLDSTWHVPTNDEWRIVLSREGISNSATGFSSNLKLTGGGRRDASSGNKTSVGLRGYYWSSVVCNNFGNGTQTAYQVNIGGSSASATACRAVGDGMAIRCVKSPVPSTAIKATSGYGSLNIYPNPANGSVTIRNIPNGATLRIADITGKTVYSTAAATATETVNTAGFAAGVYTVQVINNGAVFNGKLVVAR